MSEDKVFNEGANGFHLYTVVSDGYGNLIAEDADGNEIATVNARRCRGRREAHITLTAAILAHGVQPDAPEPAAPEGTATCGWCGWPADDELGPLAAAGAGTGHPVCIGSAAEEAARGLDSGGTR